MQTVDEFIKKHKGKNKKSKDKNFSHKTVVDWCTKGYIPGAVQDTDNGEWLIPDHAMLPYTDNKYRGGNSPYYSMVNACIRQRHIVAALYDMDEARFQGYIKSLIDAGFITEYLDGDGIIHYQETISGIEAVKAGRGKFKALLEPTLKVAEIAVSALGVLV